jgi:mRNA-degrading endonuclease toxin of MazEF toxin-antitoxin module
VARRGDVLQLKRRLGFGARGTTESFVVVQDDRLNQILPTTVAVPLDLAIAVHDGNPLAVAVSPTEAGDVAPHVAVGSHPSTIPWDKFEPAVAGHLEPATLARLDAVLRVVLTLPQA